MVWLYNGDYKGDETSRAQADHVTRETRIAWNEVRDVDSSIVETGSEDPRHDGECGTTDGAHNNGGLTELRPQNDEDDRNDGGADDRTTEIYVKWMSDVEG